MRRDRSIKRPQNHLANAIATENSLTPSHRAWDKAPLRRVVVIHGPGVLNPKDFLGYYRSCYNF